MGLFYVFNLRDLENNPLNVRKSDQSKSYNKIIINEEGKILGSIISIDKDKITIKEIQNYQCFFAIDYVAEGLSHDQIDTKYNDGNLPWCTDPSGATYYVETGKNLVFKLDDKTIFSIIDYSNDGIRFSTTTRDAFLKLEQANQILKITAQNETALHIEEVYVD